ncbi:TonB-dependent receptor [Mucilaginibacter hurinus]|uniref:TonB-dependent receptor n=1 Tax=Mucilaginibacter hurinus TaxID=2201324 RepID=A0A367GKS2_9SPHI|nr:TonB-dependent receptor [Mucilaginibacter hurinus]RCH54077.1 TonB-dependent receptor [Mucilaginibacter hurinus]
MLQRLLLFIAILNLANTAMALPLDSCNLIFKGTVIDGNTNTLLKGATIIINGQIKASSPEFAEFTFNDICPGLLIIKVTTPGYADTDTVINITSARQVIIKLYASSKNLSEVQISASRPHVHNTAISSQVSNTDLQQARGSLLAEALANIPGVNMLRTGTGIAKPVIQGLHSNHLLTLNNGIRQEGQQWGAEHGPEIDPFIAGRLTVLKGAEAIRFGPEAVGGVILVEPAELPQKKGIQGGVNLVGGTNGRYGVASLMLEGAPGKLKGFAWRVIATKKRSGNIQTADYYMNNTGTDELSFAATLGHKTKRLETELYYSRFNTSIGIFNGAHIGNVTDLTDRIANGRPFENGTFSYAIGVPRQNIVHNLFKFKAGYQLNPVSRLNVIYGLQRNNRQEYDLRRKISETPSLDLVLTTQTLDINFETFSTNGWKTTAGLSGLLQVNNSVPGTLATPLVPNFDSYGAGGYLVARLIRNSYELEGGIRFDHKGLSAAGYRNEIIDGTTNQVFYTGNRKFNNITASVGGVLHINDHLDIRTNVGSAWRPPVVSELYSDGLHHGTAAYERGNSMLTAEKSYKWITSVDFNKQKVQIQASAYVNLIYDYIYLQPSNQLYESLRGVFPTFDYKQTDATFAGADFLMTYNFLPAFGYELKGSAVRARDIKNQLYLPWIPADRVENSISWNIGGKPENFIKLGYQFVAKQTQYNAGSDYAAPPPAYHLLNVNAGTKIRLPNRYLNLNCTINNLTNKLYKDYMNRFRYYAHEMGINFILRASYNF